jgi:hypothetical protein
MLASCTGYFNPEERPPVTMDKKLSGTHRQSGWYDKEKNTALPGIEPWSFSPVTI